MIFNLSAVRMFGGPLIWSGAKNVSSMISGTETRDKTDAISVAIAMNQVSEVGTRSGVPVAESIGKMAVAVEKALENLVYTLGVMTVDDAMFVLTVTEIIFPRIWLTFLVP